MRQFIYVDRFLSSNYAVLQTASRILQFLFARCVFKCMGPTPPPLEHDVRLLENSLAAFCITRVLDFNEDSFLRLRILCFKKSFNIPITKTSQDMIDDVVFARESAQRQIDIDARANGLSEYLAEQIALAEEQGVEPNEYAIRQSYYDSHPLPQTHYEALLSTLNIT